MSTQVKEWASEYLVHMPCFPGTLEDPGPGKIGFMESVLDENHELIGLKCSECGYTLKFEIPNNQTAHFVEDYGIHSGINLRKNQ